MDSRLKAENHLKVQNVGEVDLLDGISDGFVALDTGMRYTYVNRKAVEIFGLPAEKLIRQHLVDVFPDAGNSATFRAAERALRERVSVVNEEYYAQRGLWYENRIYPTENGLSVFMTDISKRKYRQRRENLTAEISSIFNQPAQLPDLLKILLQRLMKELGAKLAEAWLIGLDAEYMMLNAQTAAGRHVEEFFNMRPDFHKVTLGQGLPGITWANGKVEVWNNLPHQSDFLRSDAAAAVGINTGVGIPLFFNNKIIGVLLFGFDRADYADQLVYELAGMFTLHLGAEIKRKQLEGELEQVINGAPDIVCVVGLDRRFKKVNNATTRILGYSEDELLTLAIDALIHPDDLLVSRERMKKFRTGESRFMYFENRYIRKDGQTVFLAWTANKADDGGVLFCMAKDITDKKKLEEGLQRTSEQARMGNWEVNLDNGKVSWSAVSRDILEAATGLDPSPQDAWLFSTLSNVTFMDDAIKQLIQSGKTFDVELEIQTFKNNKRWVRVTGEGCFDGEKCRRVIGSLQDIDQRKRAELAANQILQERNMILESIGDGFISVDQSWNITYWNKTAAAVTKTIKSKVLGRSIWDVFSAAVNQIVYDQFHAAVSDGQTRHFEYHYETLNKWFDISAYPSSSGLSVYFRDITERKKAEVIVAEQRRELMESQKRYRELFQLSPLPKFVFDTETLQFLDANPAMLDHYGYTLDEFLKLTLRDIRPPELIPHMEKAVKRAAKSSVYHQPDIFTHKKRDGTLIQVEVVSRALDFMGKQARMSAVTDVTEKQKYLREIEAQNKALKEISWMQSHIVRAPLARLVGLVGLLENSTTAGAEQQQILDYMRASADELDDVIKDITQNANIGIA